ncbi:MAG TPA: fluoride efflux transporter CrcB [Bacteroidota bacterium]|nr:fluoride efflux transporter CrcB [Bacteroidota bacterium]
MNFVLVFIGGGVGATARYWAAGTVQKWVGSGFPYGTFVVNVLGCFIIGFLMAAFEERFVVTPSLRIFLTIGILGGFTTFSSFSFETISLVRDSEFLLAALNIGLTLFTCLSGTTLGILLGKLF